MHILNTGQKTRIFKLYLLTFIWPLFILISLEGCVQDDSFQQAQHYVRQSQIYYQKAVERYKDLIAQGKDLDELHYRLGQIYFSHGDFQQAQEEFKKTNIQEAKKFLAISFYRLGNFTDALDIFSKYEIDDEEYLYYYGLTCEKLNLFDKALSVYGRIKSENLFVLAKERIQTIKKEAGLIRIEEIDPKVHRLINQAPNQQDYPQAGALILSCDEKIEVTADNKQIIYLHYIVKILNERGKDKFSESSIDYDSTYEKVELEYARTIRPDGTVIDVGSRHIRDVSKYLNFPLYSNARAYIISFPEVTEGAVIEYKAKVHCNQMINKKDLVLSYPVQSSEPVISANFSIALPKDRILKIKTLNEQYNDFGADLKPNIKTEEGYIIYGWQFKDIPQIIPESNMPASVEINPTMVVSTFTQWQQVYEWWWGLTKDKIEPSDAIRQKVKELTQGLDSQEAKARAIYNFCAQEIRYVAVEYGEAGYEPHQANDVFTNKYGDCKDQAILLVCMLREAGLLAYPVLISTRDYYDLNEDFPAVIFNHCIAAVLIEDRLVFLDPTSQTCLFGDLPADDQARKVLLFKEDGYTIHSTPLYPAAHNLSKQHLKIRINEDESIFADKFIFSYGIYDQAQRFWLIYTPPELIEQALQERIQDISIGAQLKDYRIENLKNLNEPVILDYSFYGPEYFTSAGRLRILPQLSGMDTSWVAKRTRRYPIDFTILDSKETIVEIEIPANFAIRYIPNKIKEESRWLDFSVDYTQQANRIIFTEKINLKKNKIFSDEYPEVKEFVESLAKQTKQRIVLEKIR
ncbi:MAG: DUF3857 domain-containing protein [Candidatus Omnitrophica bacterium]|nr:DUF3857 domain-containing protein [Candidatus Omnitrophota bacterium]